MSEERAIDHLPDQPPAAPVAGLCAATTVLGGILGPGGIFLALTMDIGGAVVALVAAVVVGVVIGASDRHARGGRFFVLAAAPFWER